MKKCVRTDPTIPSYMAVYVGLIINKGIPDSSLDMCLLEKWKQMKVIPASVIQYHVLMEEETIKMYVEGYPK